MCIRDSAKDVANPPKLVVAGGLDEADYVEGLQPLLTERTVCLLYTSDAADERSSVDLGGRRIIKKQKKTLTL